MDYLLLILILTIVICMGYILSKPFIKQDDRLEAVVLEDEQKSEYDQLLTEIKYLERYCNAGLITEDDCKILIEAKKIEAAELLRSYTGPIGSDQKGGQPFTAPDESQEMPQALLKTAESLFCPKCGDQVLMSDKFCVHCGFRLQP
jgi:hypothetical protein